MTTLLTLAILNALEIGLLCLIYLQVYNDG